MALRFIDSFDHYQTADIAKKWTVASGYIVTDGRNGKCWQGGAGTNRLILTLDNQDTWIVGFAYKYTAPAYDEVLVRFDDHGKDQFRISKYVDGTILAVCGNSNLGTSTYAIPASTWVYIEVKAVISKAGSFEVRVNGTTVLSRSGVVTQYTANAYANDVEWAGSYGVAHYIDDLYILDGTGTTNNNFLGDVRIGCIFPDGNGNTSNFTGSDSDSVDNYLLVDEKSTDYPDDDTTYVQSGTPGHKDTYQFEDVSYLPGETTIDGIQVLVCAKKTATGDKTICPVVRVGGEDYDGDNWNPSDASYSYMRQVHEQTPGADNWTPASINAAEFGHKVVV